MSRNDRALPLRLCAALLLWCAAADAQTIDASSTTLLAGRADPRDGKLYTAVPLYELVSLELGDVKAGKLDELRAVVSGWGRADLGSNMRFDGNLDLAFIDASLFKRRVELRAGRFLVWGGAQRMLPVDGGELTLRPWKGLTLNVFGGVPVTYEFAAHIGDALGGGRLSWKVNYNTEVGVSFLHVQDKGRAARQEVAVDARVVPHRTLTLSAFVSMSTLEERLVEANVAADYHPLYWLQVRADYLRTAPDLWIPRSSIFSVFTMESRDEGGVSLFVRPVSRLRLDGDYHVIHDASGLGHRGSARARLMLGAAFQSWIGIEESVIQLPEQGYVRTRVTAAHHFLPVLLLTLDGDVYYLAKDVNGQRLSVTGAATLGWDFAPHWSAVVAAVADTTPLVEQRFEGMIKLVYNRTFRVHEVRR